MGAWEKRRFLIVVKTYPNPSESVQEAVCTAAIRDDGVFTRLFPIPFRTLEEASKFPKWSWIEANVTKARSDSRTESFKVDETSIKVIETLPAGRPGWQKRWKWIEPILSPSLEALQSTPASLGVIKPLTYDLVFEDADTPTWTPHQEAKLRGMQGAQSLFGTSSIARKLLEKLPVKISYSYTCSGEACSGHTQLFEDWEVGQCWRSWRIRYPERDRLEAAIRQKYVLEAREKDNLFFFLGTHARFGSWLVIGHAKPLHLAQKAIVAPGSS